MKIRFLLGILILVALTAITVEATTLSNCLAVCGDSAGCTCPNYCTISGTVSNNENCGGEVTTCSQENRRYWLRDKDCQSTCGDFDNDFMINKGWTKVDYNCYTNEKTPIEKKNETVKITEETTEKTTEETNETASGNLLKYSAVGLAVVVIALIVWFILKRKKR